MSKGAFKALLKEARKTDSYWVEKAILEFSSELHMLMKSKGTSKTELAAIIGTSPAYITKVFRGNANFTIESMVKLTRALDGRLHFHVSGEEKRTRWFDVIDGGKNRIDENYWSD
ncbi:MAG: helix-turn-helix domain-containing protein, partial [Geopsychrobacter sp.]|nr:helix-turn-helix domain-containing protein [Geopsychrobacter sp.]